MDNIPYNLNSQNYGSYGDGLNGTIKMPIPSSISDVNEMSISWGTTIGKIVGRAKGFGGIGTLTQGQGRVVPFPTTFLNLPIVKIKLLAPLNYSHFDDVYIAQTKITGRSLIWGNTKTLPDFFDNREAVWNGFRIVHDAWERRDTPLQMQVYKDRFQLYHNNTERIESFGALDYKTQINFDARGESLIYIWHAIGV